MQSLLARKSIPVITSKWSTTIFRVVRLYTVFLPLTSALFATAFPINTSRRSPSLARFSSQSTNRNMSVQRFETHNPDEFYSFLQQAEASQSDNIYLLFTGSKNPSTGQSWCPDCVRAHPLIENILPTLPGKNVFITMNVDREPYRSPDYVFRKDSKIALRCVPTLIKWVDGKAETRLNDDQSQQIAALQEFFA